MGGFASRGWDTPKKPVLPAPGGGTGFAPGGTGFAQPVGVNGAPGGGASGGMMAASGGGGFSAGAVPATPVVNTAQVNPDMAGFLEQYKNKLNSNLAQPNTDPNLQTQVDRLGQRLSTDTTQHAIDRAQGNIRDQASGLQAGLKTRNARSGVEGGAAMQMGQNIEGRSQRAQAGAASDISLGRERDLDALTLGGQNIMSAPGQFTMQKNQQDLGGIAGGISGANTPAQLQLGQQNLGLQQWQAGNNAQNQNQDRAMAQWLAMMKMSGGGY